jgi:hypothetical protein
VALVPSRATFLVALPAVLVLVAACVSMPLVGVARDGPLQIFTPAGVAVAAARAGAAERPVHPTTAPHPGMAKPRGLAARSPRSLPEDLPSAPSPQAPIEEASEASEALDPLPAIALAHLDLGVAPAGAPGVTLTAPVHDAPWRAAVDAGLAIGSGSRYAALKTAAAFTRLGKSFANPY